MDCLATDVSTKVEMCGHNAKCHILHIHLMQTVKQCDGGLIIGLVLQQQHLPLSEP